MLKNNSKMMTIFEIQIGLKTVIPISEGKGTLFQF